MGCTKKKDSGNHGEIRAVETGRYMGMKGFFPFHFTLHMKRSPALAIPVVSGGTTSLYGLLETARSLTLP